MNKQVNYNKLLLPIRIAMAILFIGSGIPKIFMFSAIVHRMSLTGFFPGSPALFLIIGIAIELLGALSMLTGYRMMESSLILAFFILYASIAMHTSTILEIHIPTEIVRTFNESQSAALVKMEKVENIVRIIANTTMIAALLSIFLFQKKISPPKIALSNEVLA